MEGGLTQAPPLMASVVIPTIGRPLELRKTLASLSACHPRAAEVVVVDQSASPAVASTIADFASFGAVRVASSGRGIGLAVNEGLTRARHHVVLGTHDDCSVAADWVAVSCELAARAPDCIFTGRVLPVGDATLVPSTKDDPLPHDFTGETSCQVLYPSNMVLPRDRVLAFGGFDERLPTAAEDNDFCYRWLRAGLCLRYDPRLVVWHRDWRAPADLHDLYLRYAREQGRFYAKHLRMGDTQMVRFAATDLLGALRALVHAGKALATGTPPEISDADRGILRGTVPGMFQGWRDFKKTGEDSQ